MQTFHEENTAELNSKQPFHIYPINK